MNTNVFVFSCFECLRFEFKHAHGYIAKGDNFSIAFRIVLNHIKMDF